MTKIAYCPHCESTRELKRKDFDICLAIVLLFTGIGFIIYIIYYFTQPKNKCSSCGSTIPKKMFTSKIDHERIYYKGISAKNEKNRSKNQKIAEEQIIQGDTKKFCSLCGGQIKDDSNYCPFCESTVE